MHLQIIIDELERIASLKYAETWDNVGLLTGDIQQQITGIMLCIDLTAEIIQEAETNQCNLIIAYHPPLFKAINRITSSSLIFSAIQKNIAIYSPHTALDCTPNGINAVLAARLELNDAIPLRMKVIADQYFKLITFVPKNALTHVSNALFAVGAGHIGNYSHCSFQIDGTGTFLGNQTTNPTIGTPGKLEQTPEVRFETIIPADSVANVVSTLYQSHPYEEPAFDLIPLTVVPHKVGQGRIGVLTTPTSIAAIIKKVKQQLKLDHVLVTGSTDKIVSRIACLAGAGGEFIPDAIAQNADVLLTGEVRHHDALRAAAAGLTVICTLHSNSERLVLIPLQNQLIEKCAKIKVLISTNDKDPLNIC